MNNGPKRINAFFPSFGRWLRMTEIVETDAEDIREWLAIESRIQADQPPRHNFL